MTTYQLIQWTPVEGSDLADTYNTEQEAIDACKACLYDEFDGVMLVGGSYHVQDEDGNGVYNC